MQTGIKRFSLMLFGLSAVAAAQPAQAEIVPGPGGISTSYCREYTQTVRVAGRLQNSYGTACQQPDGSWAMLPSAPTIGQPIAPPQFVDASPYPAAPSYYPRPVYYYPPSPVYYAPAPSVGFSSVHVGYGYGPRWGRHW